MDTVYRSAELGAVLVEHEGALQVVTGTERYVRFTLPGDAVELHDADDAVEEVLDRVRHALSSVKMSAKARADVANALDDLA